MATDERTFCSYLGGDQLQVGCEVAAGSAQLVALVLGLVEIVGCDFSFRLYGNDMHTPTEHRALNTMPVCNIMVPPYNFGWHSSH